MCSSRPVTHPDGQEPVPPGAGREPGAPPKKMTMNTEVLMLGISERQRAALWLRAQGLTAEAIGRRLDPPCSGPGAQDLLHKVIVRLGAKDSPHAVFLGLTLGVIGPYRDCGTRKAYLRHLRRNEQSCIACRRANTAYVRAQRDAVPLPDDEAGNRRGNQKTEGLTERQIEVLSAMQSGAQTAVEVAQKVGIGESRARRHVRSIMEKFRIDMTVYGRPESFRRAVDRGIDLGYLTDPYILRTSG